MCFINYTNSSCHAKYFIVTLFHNLVNQCYSPPNVSTIVKPELPVKASILDRC